MAATSAGQIASAPNTNCEYGCTGEVAGSESVCSAETLIADCQDTQGLLCNNVEHAEYESDHTDIVNVFVNGGNGVTHELDVSQDTSMAYVPQSTQQMNDVSILLQQNEVQLLDNELRDLPKELYIEKIRNLVKDSEQLIMWYRNILCSRSQSIQGCPQGKMITRKTTKRSFSVEKYANDCYILTRFLQGERCNIEDVFEKTRVVSVSSDIPRGDVVEIRATIQSLLQKVNLLEQDNAAKDKTISALSENIKSLREENVNLATELNQLKTSVNGLKTKVTAHIKSVGEMETSGIDNSKTVASEVDRLSKVCMNMQRQISTIPKSQTFSTATSTPSRPQIPSPTSSTVDVLIHDEGIQNRSLHGSPINARMHDQSRIEDKNQVVNTVTPSNLTFVTVSDEELTSGSENIRDDPDFFRGVTYNRKARFHISRIDRRTNKDAIVNYLRNKGVTVTHILMFYPRSDRSKLCSAKINVPIGQGRIVDSEGFWPDGVRCRRWLSRSQWDKRNDRGRDYDEEENWDRDYLRSCYDDDDDDLDE
ncbi:hypothetical protein FSP39_007412 [Pinctada imbricata]|uniref:Uncharacterized protein n=1 Tax=Pinctada imbricata TaxID=66713 RepID=A0AA89BZ03_PINIB|nr:hypothetical protein FSP39_007412 [Pinctada imbricata]